MKLYLISQSVDNGYDTYDSVVVAAENEEEAKLINPGGEWTSNSWCSNPDQVEVEYIGEAAPRIPKGIVLSSFNAG